MRGTVPPREAGEPIGELERRIRAAVEAAPPSPRQASLRAAIPARLPGASRTTRRRLSAIALAALLTLAASGALAAPFAADRIPLPLREAIVEILGDLGVTLPGPGPEVSPWTPAAGETPAAEPADGATIPPTTPVPTLLPIALPTPPADAPPASPDVTPPADTAPPPVPTDVPSAPAETPTAPAATPTAPPLPASASPSIPPLP